MMNDKYVVTKRDTGEVVQDCFVLKAGDVLAVSALRSYANNCMLMVEFDRMNLLRMLSQEERIRLIEMADDVMTMAEQWEELNHMKLPD